MAAVNYYYLLTTISLLNCIIYVTADLFSAPALISGGTPNFSNSHNRLRRAAARRRAVVRYPTNFLIKSMPPNQQQKKDLLDKHNMYRAMVPAQDMRYMFWTEDMAKSAQRHADRCDFRHSKDRRNTGENIWVAPYGDYSDAVRLWYVEVHDPKCRCPHSYKKCCGHYTQVVWSKSYRMGCGAAYCRDIWGVRGRSYRYSLVCHYNPSGNTVMVTPKGQFALPAFKWTNGTAQGCSACPPGLNNCYNRSLCW